MANEKKDPREAQKRAFMERAVLAIMPVFCSPLLESECDVAVDDVMMLAGKFADRMFPPVVPGPVQTNEAVAPEDELQGQILQVLAKYGPQTEAQIAARLEEMFPSAPPASTNVSVAPAPGITTVTVPR